MKGFIRTCIDRECFETMYLENLGQHRNLIVRMGSTHLYNIFGIVMQNNVKLIQYVLFLIKNKVFV